MSGLVYCAFALVLGYFVGSTPFGLLIGKFNGIDIRRYGSGNIGATNVNRVLGKGWGVFCFAMDLLKGLVPVLLLIAWTEGEETLRTWTPVLAAGGAVAGHVWPWWLRFRGGKGVSTTIGAVVGLAPWSVLAALVGWGLIFKLSRYVSLASLGAAVILPLSALIISIWAPIPVPTTGLLFLLCVVIVVRHRSNIARLRAGTENRFEKRSTEAA